MSPKGSSGQISVVSAVMAALVLLACTLATSGFTGKALARSESVETQPPVLINAREVGNDQGLGIITARGNVELSKGKRILLADLVSYNTNTGLVTASGNVSLLEPSGDVVFASHVELTEDLKEGFIKDIRMLLSDKSRLASATGQLLGGDLSILNKSVYSPCNLCEEDPTQAPIWQIKADRVIHNKKEKKLTYHNVWMEFFGTPVIYTPWLQFPDPTVERSSGFLAPSFSFSGALGQTVQIPYYWAIDDDKSLTLAPIFTSKEGLVAYGSYEQVFATGNFNFEGSITQASRSNGDGTTEDDALRWHIDMEADFLLDNTWRYGFDFNRSSDNSYLRRYDLNDTDDSSALISTAYFEGVSGRNYARVDAYSFQSLRDDIDTGELPFLAPRLTYSFRSEPTAMGLTTRFDGGVQALSRTSGRDTYRLSTTTGLELPYVGSAGDVYEFTARVQEDFYYTKDFIPGSSEVNPSGDLSDEFAGRFFPQAAVKWRYPLVSTGPGFVQTIEPVVQVILAPSGSNSGEIPNDDSEFEFDDTSLFALNRFTGTDRVDYGSRINYGLKWGVVTERGDAADILFGQSYNLTNEDIFAQIDGLQEKRSDYVGHVNIYTIENLVGSYQFRLDEDDLGFRQNEISLAAGPAAYRFNVNYLYSKDAAFDDATEDNREEINLFFNSQVSRYWSVEGNYSYNLKTSQSNSGKLGLTYNDECFVFTVGMEREFYVGEDLEQDTVFSLGLTFKNLGATKPL